MTVTEYRTFTLRLVSTRHHSLEQRTIVRSHLNNLRIVLTPMRALGWEV